MDTTGQKIDIKDVYKIRIANIVDKFMQEEEVFRQRVDRDNIVSSITDSLYEKYSLENFLAIEDSDLKQRIGQRMATEGLYGLLDDLTPEQIKAFDDAVSGKNKIVIKPEFYYSKIESPDTPSVYKGKPLTLEDMDKAILTEAGKRK